MRKNLFAVLIATLLVTLLYAVPGAAGGWAVVTLTYLPPEIEAQSAFTVEFSVRDHGQILGAGHNPTIYFYQSAGKDFLRFNALETRKTGNYAAEVTLPNEGLWQWRISPYNAPGTGQTMPVLTALPAAGISRGQSPGNLQAAALSLAGAGLPGAVFSFYIFLKHGRKAALGLAIVAALLVLLAAPALLDREPATAQAAQTNALASYSGQQLFMAKGCVVCHDHDRGRQGYEGLQSNIGPNLSELKLPAGYLRVWLANPPSVKPKTLMPDLDLSNGEIEELVAFLSGD